MFPDAFLSFAGARARREPSILSGAPGIRDLRNTSERPDAIVPRAGAAMMRSLA